MNLHSEPAAKRSLVKAAGILAGCILYMVTQTALYSQALNIDEISRSVVQIENSDISGSGIFISLDDDIFILTNRHVVTKHDSLTISILHDLNEPARPAYIAGLHAFSPDLDVALLKIISDLENNPVNAFTLICGITGPDPCIHVLKLEKDLKDISRGDEVALMGYPGIGENELVYSRGIIASVKYEEHNDERMPVWFRTGADMSSGISGGLAVTMSGRVIGLPTYVRSEFVTGGRIGNILSSQAILASLSSDRLLNCWDGFIDPDHELDIGIPPMYGSADIRADTLSGPHIIEVIAGGEKNLSYLGEECAGYAAAGPDYSLSWSGNSDTLYIRFLADSPEEDATMIIKAPGGTWHCNDDAYEGTLDPAIIFTDPDEGEYLIWVGSYLPDTFIEGVIIIADNMPDEDHNVLDYKLSPIFGERNMATGFMPDPFRISVVASGSINLAETNIVLCCAAYAEAAPDYRIHWSGTGSALNINFIAADPADDALLIINSPDGLWHCNDDANKNTFNPMIKFSDPSEGQYDIWIGTHNENEFIEGFLIISENDDVIL